jgi:hypothetical protein
MLSKPRKGEYAISVAGHEARLLLSKLTTTMHYEEESRYVASYVAVVTIGSGGRRRVYRCSWATSKIRPPARSSSD